MLYVVHFVYDNARRTVVRSNPGATPAACWLQNHMGPILRRDHPDVKILGYDHNKDVVDQYAQGFAEDPEAQQFIDGLGVHWCVTNK